MQEHTTTYNSRTISFTDWGISADAAVLWCHGGPGSRHEPKGLAPAARELGIRLIGIDRPGYGGSTVQPGRRIGDWAADAIAVADALDIERFFTLGVSTGGAYALATAAAEPRRVRGVMTCCAMTDMAWAGEHAPMGPNEGIWTSADREHAIRVATDDFGSDGSKMLEGDLQDVLSPSDIAFITDPESGMADDRERFAQGVDGYADDRLADAPVNGWGSFDINAVTCPVTIIHGEADKIVPVAHSRHTAELLPQAELTTYPEAGHLSVIGEVPPKLRELIDRA